MACSIYGLFDPRLSLDPENCRYIGKTTIPIDDRLDQHIYTADAGHPGWRNNWVRKLRRENTDPAIMLLDKADDESKLNVLEREWIARGRSLGWQLTNMTDGGDGISGYRFTDEQRKRLSEIVIQRHIDDPGIGERKRAGQIRRFANDPELRRISSEQMAATIAAMDQSDQWCPDCGDGPFRGVWGLKGHLRYDHDSRPTTCPDCGSGPFAGAHGVIMHQMHRHWTTKEPMPCDCGEGPFDGQHGLSVHQGKFCPLRHPDGRMAQSERLTAVYAGNTDLRSRIADLVTEARANEDKAPTMCPCGAGPFIGPRAVLIHQGQAGACTVGHANPETVAKRQQGAAVMAAQYASANGNAAAKRIRKCNDCDMVTNAASLGGHQKRSGHTGWTAVSA